MRIPSAGTPIKMKDLIKAYTCSYDFEEELKKMLRVKYCFAVNSGTTAFYIILNALKKLSNKEEVLLPAYTAPSLILPIRKAGLKYRLVDISFNTFNMDIEKTGESINNNTLAVLCVHMFGIPVDIERIRVVATAQHPHPNPPPSIPPSPCERGIGGGGDELLKGIFIIEDAASSFGTRKGNKFSSTFGDIGFISFNRGKNLSTVSGGVIVTDNDTLGRAIHEEIEKLPFADLFTKAKISLKALALSFAVRPWFYTIFRQGISIFKYTTLHKDFDSFHYTAFQGSLGCSILKRSEEIFSDREEKGMMLYNELKHMNGIKLPAIPEGWNTVFTHFPLLVEDAEKRKSVVEAVIRAGLEATILYENPINKIYDDFTKSNNEEYPNAEYLAERLVLIPVHHYVTVRSLCKSIEAIKKTLKSC